MVQGAFPTDEFPLSRALQAAVGPGHSHSPRPSVIMPPVVVCGQTQLLIGARQFNLDFWTSAWRTWHER